MDLISWSESLGYLAAAAVLASFAMKNMMALRLVALVSNVAFISYALADGLTPVLVLHSLLLPLNLFRLAQMQRIAREAERAVNRDEGFSWLLPVGESVVLGENEVLFRKDDAADAMYVIAEGEIEIVGYGAVLGPGDLLGEIGLFSREQKRMATARARTPARLSRITGAKVRRLHFDNPYFAFQVTRLIANRLLDDVRAEGAADRAE
jgi:CRP/FNR family cyclic AMP-dependent transcriptional regulator